MRKRVQISKEFFKNYVNSLTNNQSFGEEKNLYYSNSKKSHFVGHIIDITCIDGKKYFPDSHHLQGV